eukprot:2932271-Pleurochrysis_carterae.AAC.1
MQTVVQEAFERRRARSSDKAGHTARLLPTGARSVGRVQTHLALAEHREDLGVEIAEDGLAVGDEKLA